MFNIDRTKFRKGLLAFCVLLLIVNLYVWLAGVAQTSRFQHLRGVVLAAALVANVAAALVRGKVLQRAFLALNVILLLAFFVLFFAR